MSAITLFVRFLQVLTILLVISLLSLFGHIFWGFDLLAHFRVQFIGLTLIVFLILLALRIRTLTLIAGVVLLLHGLDYASVYQHRAPEPSERGQPGLRLMALNMWEKNQEQHQVIEQVKEHNPDVLVLIEAQDETLRLMQGLRDRYPYFYPLPQQNWLQMAIFSSVPWEKIAFPKFPRVNRTLLEVKLRTARGPVSVLLVHTQSAIWRQDTLKRNQELQEIASYIRQKPADERVIAVGDFNVTPWSAAYRGFVRDSGLMTTQPGILRPTWPLWMPWPLQIPIDHAFLSDGLSLVQKERGGDAGSDHAPVLYEINW